MKVLKSATQKNVLVNCDYYTMDEINGYLDKHVFFTFNEKIEVIYNREYQCYTNVAVLNDGTNIYVTI